MAVDQTNEIEKLSGAIAEVGKNLQAMEDNYVSKTEFVKEGKKLADMVDALNKTLDKQRLVTKSDPLFGTKEGAEEFLDVCRGALAKSAQYQKAVTDNKSPWFVEKDLNVYTTGSGADTVPTTTSSIFSYLLAQGGVARKNCTIMAGIQGTEVLPKRNGTSTFAFTASGGTLEEDAAVTPSVFGTSKVSLTPQQVSILSYVSDKLLYSSAINVAEIIAIDMAEQSSVGEDNTVLKGDGTATYGGVTGYKNDSNVPTQNVSAASFASGSLDELLNMPSKVHESVYKSPNAKYFMSGAILSAYKQKKASTSGLYFLDPTTGEFRIGGYPVEIWHRLDQTVATGNMVALFGDLRKATTIGLGRDYTVLVSREFKMNTNQVAWRLSYDFASVNVQPTAVAKLVCTS